MTSVARQFQLSEPTVRRWRTRYRTHGLVGLQDHSRAPKSSPQRLPVHWREELLQLRRKHPRWGADKLRCLLRELHPRTRCLPSSRSLERWLSAEKLTHPPPPRTRSGRELLRPALTAARRPNDVWTIDFKGWFRAGNGQRCEPLTVRDLASRYIFLVRLVPQLSDHCVRPLLRSLFQRHGRPKIIRVDNGAPFAGKGALNLTTLSVFWLNCRIGVEFTRPAKPQDNGAHEQMHRELKAATASPPAPTARAQQRRLDRWMHEYNHLRPHAAINLRCPAQLYRDSPRPWQRPKSFAYPLSQITRQVRNRGAIKFHGRLRFIGRAFVGQTIGLKKLTADQHEVYLGSLCLGVLHQNDSGGMRPCRYAQRPQVHNTNP